MLHQFRWESIIKSAVEKSSSRNRWRGPTVQEIARRSGVGTATVDRVLNGRSGVREDTRRQVLAALRQLGGGVTGNSAAGRRIAFLSDSGTSYNQSLGSEVTRFGRDNSGITCSFTAIRTAKVDPIKFAQLIEREGAQSDGVVVVAREHLIINRAIRAVVGRGVPVVTLTTDLPGSGRLAFVGNDHIAAGATAAYLMGQAIGPRRGKILLVYSVPYRVQEERELGFRRVLRSELPHLAIDDRVNSNDETEFSYRNVCRYIDEQGAPVGIYNVSAGNLGIGRALADRGLAGKTVFIGHELNANSRLLLETGQMSFVVGHDVGHEVELAVAAINAHLDQRPPPDGLQTMVRIHTKYNCR